jgi:hypothetical protein
MNNQKDRTFKTAGGSKVIIHKDNIDQKPCLTIFGHDFAFPMLTTEARAFFTHGLELCDEAEQERK